jgi:hypothetical protein
MKMEIFELRSMSHSAPASPRDRNQMRRFDYPKNDFYIYLHLNHPHPLYLRLTKMEIFELRLYMSTVARLARLHDSHLFQKRCRHL